MLGKQLGGFEIGRGGMGVVYRARQLSLDREVALKTLLPGLELDEALVERFQAEARAASRINHPNLVQVYDVGSEGGTQYIAMELVEGESLKVLIRQAGPMDYLRAAATTSQVAAALGALHTAGIVHRDVKPSNILMRPDGLVKITDFGVALLQEGARRLTREGIVFYQILTGEVPFSGPTPLVVMQKHCEEEAPSLRRARPEVPDRLAEIVGRCLAKEPEERYQTAEALCGDLDHVRLALEFAALSAETPPGGQPSVYSTQAVAALQRQQVARKGLARRLLGRLWVSIASAWRYAAGTLDRDVLGLRRAAAGMEDALGGLAEAKRRRADLRKRATELREQAETARRQSGEAFDRDEVVRAEELVEEERRCNEAAIDFESVAEALSETARDLAERYKAAGAEHERLRLKVELRQAQAVQVTLGAQAIRGRRRARLAAGATIALLVLCVAGYLVWPKGDVKVNLMPPYPQVYRGAPIDRISVQFAVTEISRQAGLSYNWDESVKKVGRATRAWTNPKILNLTWEEGMRTYELKGTEVILRKQQEATKPALRAEAVAALPSR
ncbi:MAG: protein kinase domain-containing protein [Planctomycetota bacterium]|jgi:tRNA A-37 threonylcarbamoyl transferase component Bud32